MNDVSAARLMTTLTTSTVMVAPVLSAFSLQALLLGLPSGAVADVPNRRRSFMFTQFRVAANAIAPGAAMFAGWMTAPLLLVLTFGNGIGHALRWPACAVIVPELVPRRELPLAIAPNGIAMNTSRVVGPVPAGAPIASLGSGDVFVPDAVLWLAAGFEFMRWRAETKTSVLPGERFVGALRVGLPVGRTVAADARRAVAHRDLHAADDDAVCAAAPGRQAPSRRQRLRQGSHCWRPPSLFTPDRTPRRI